MSDPRLLATFREDSVVWAKFQAKAKRNNTNASALLQRFVRDYLDDNLDNRLDNHAAPDVDVEAMIANLRGSIDSELREIKHDISLISEATNQLVIENLQADVTVAHQRLEALEAIATAKKPLMQLVKEKVLAA